MLCLLNCRRLPTNNWLVTLVYLWRTISQDIANWFPKLLVLDYTNYDRLRFVYQWQSEHYLLANFFISTEPKMVAKEAAFFLFITLSPLALGSKTPLKPKGSYNSVATKRRCSLLNKYARFVSSIKKAVNWDVSKNAWVVGYFSYDLIFVTFGWVAYPDGRCHFCYLGPICRLRLRDL